LYTKKALFAKAGPLLGIYKTMWPSLKKVCQTLV